MSYKESVLDKISRATSPIIRRLSDLNILLVGTKTQCLRITRSSPNEFGGKTFDVFGDYDDNVVVNMNNATGFAVVLNNVIIKYPFNTVEMFMKKDALATSSKVSALDLSELLPIEMVVPFEGNFNEDTIALKTDDLVVDVLFDENINKLPFILQVTKTKGSFFGKNIVGKNFDLTLYRGEPATGIKRIIDSYVNSILAP